MPPVTRRGRGFESRRPPAILFKPLSSSQTIGFMGAKRCQFDLVLIDLRLRSMKDSAFGWLVWWA